MIKLEVFEDNVRAKNLHKKFNFVKIKQKIVDERNVDCMGLDNSRYASSEKK